MPSEHDRLRWIEDVEQLSRSTKGRSAMRYVPAWLDDDGLALDHDNQEAICDLLDGAWGSGPGTVRDLMRDAIEEAA